MFNKSQTDPVCGTEIESDAQYTLTRDGTEYVFCSAQCKQEFENEPEKYKGIKKAS